MNCAFLYLNRSATFCTIPVGDATEARSEEKRLHVTQSPVCREAVDIISPALTDMVSGYPCTKALYDRTPLGGQIRGQYSAGIPDYVLSERDKYTKSLTIINFRNTDFREN